MTLWYQYKQKSLQFSIVFATVYTTSPKRLSIYIHVLENIMSSGKPLKPVKNTKQQKTC